MIGMLVAAVLTHGAAYGNPPCEEIIKPPPPKCAGLDCSDPMFTTLYPPRGSYVSAHCAELPIPLPYYDGEIMALAGSANLATLRAITAGSGYHPVATDDGHAIAILGVADLADTGVGPYHEILMGFAVNEEKVTVVADNPYVYLSELFNPANKFWAGKLLLSQLMPIDWGRELIGWDKNSVPQDITMRMALDHVKVAAANPSGKRILSGHFAVDPGPAAQAQEVSQMVTAGGEWLESFLTGGTLLPVNMVSPDVLRRSDDLVKSHIIIRIKSVPTLGRFGADSALGADPNSQFGAALDRFEFRPLVSGRLPVRVILDTGFAS